MKYKHGKCTSKFNFGRPSQPINFVERHRQDFGHFQFCFKISRFFPIKIKISNQDEVAELLSDADYKALVGG